MLCEGRSVVRLIEASACGGRFHQVSQLPMPGALIQAVVPGHTRFSGGLQKSGIRKLTNKNWHRRKAMPVDLVIE